MKEACEKRTTNILDISGKKYAFDSTTIPLCLATFPWAKFRSKKGGVKAHVLYDIEAQVPALDVANLYKKRWLIELFFKWLKQHLKIKKFWGTTENAVRIQISVAIITYSLVAIVQHDMNLKRSTYEVLQILSISLTDKTHLHDLFDKTNFNDVKDLNDPLIPGLFD